MKTAEDRLRGLLVRALAGDTAAYREFLLALSAHLRGFFRNRLRNMPEEVEDLVQETLLAVHNKRDTYDHAQPLTAWLHAIAKYKLADLLRRRRRGDGPAAPHGEAAEILAIDTREAEAARRDLGKLLETLPERLRRPIVQVKIEGRSVAETAQLTGLSEAAVKVNIHRGLKALAARMRGDV